MKFYHCPLNNLIAAGCRQASFVSKRMTNDDDAVFVVDDSDDNDDDDQTDL